MCKKGITAPAVYFRAGSRTRITSVTSLYSNRYTTQKGDGKGRRGSRTDASGRGILCPALRSQWGSEASLSARILLST